MYKYLNFSLKFFLSSNVEVMNLLLSFSKNQKTKILILCYLMANNQLKCSIINEKLALRPSDDERITNYE